MRIKICDSCGMPFDADNPTDSYRCPKCVEGGRYRPVILRRLKEPLYDTPRLPERLEFYQAPQEPVMIRAHNFFVVAMTWFLGAVYFNLFPYVMPVSGWRAIFMGISAGLGLAVLLFSNNDRARNNWFNNRND